MAETESALADWNSRSRCFPDAGASKGRIIYLLATAPTPPTASELADVMGVSKGFTRQQLRTLYERGFLVRRPRYRDEPGRPPHEYALARGDTWDDMEGEADV